MTPDFGSVRLGIASTQVQTEERQPRLERTAQNLRTGLSQTTGTQQFVEFHDVGFQKDIEKGFSRLENEMKSIQSSMASLFRVHTVSINTLANSKWELCQPLSIAVEQRAADEFVACLYDVNLYGYGGTMPEAIDDLKAVMVDQLEYLSEREGEIDLGGELKQQLTYLRKILVEHACLI